MTGKYNFRNYEKFGYLKRNQITFGNILKEAGYKTAIAGKWQLGGDISTPAHFGFDEYCLWKLFEGGFWYRYKSPGIWENGEKLNSENIKVRYGPDVFTNFVTDFIDRYRNEPFFVYYPMCLVHDPFQPTPEEQEFSTCKTEGLNDTSYFRNMVQYMDKCVGKIIDHVNDCGLSDNTIIIFTGDNGTDRKVVSTFNDKQIQGGKGYTTKAGTHVPLIVTGGSVRKRKVYNDLVDFTDILPTLADISQTSLPHVLTTDGISFLPLITKSEPAKRKFIFCDYDPKGRDFPAQTYIRNKQYKLYQSGAFFNFIRDEEENSPILQVDFTNEDRKNFKELNEALVIMNTKINKNKNNLHRRKKTNINSNFITRM